MWSWFQCPFGNIRMVISFNLMTFQRMLTSIFSCFIMFQTPLWQPWCCHHCPPHMQFLCSMQGWRSLQWKLHLLQQAFMQQAGWRWDNRSHDGKDVDWNLRWQGRWENTHQPPHPDATINAADNINATFNANMKARVPSAAHSAYGTFDPINTHYCRPKLVSRFNVAVEICGLQLELLFIDGGSSSSWLVN